MKRESNVGKGREGTKVQAGPEAYVYKRMAATSVAPSAIQQIARRRSPANQKPVAALKQRIALVHPLAQAAGLLIISRSLME
jgi:AmiR/NasT family two-component response regulator